MFFLSIRIFLTFKGASAVEKTKWIDGNICHNQSPYPVEYIEYTYTGDAG